MKETAQVIIYKKLRNEVLFLILKRKATKGGFWQPVVGKVEKNETKKEAAYRECFEEIHLHSQDVLKLHECFYSFTMDKHYLTGEPIPLTTEYVFAIETKSDFEPVISANPDSEHDSYSWAKYEKAMSLLKWNNNKNALGKFRKIMKIQ